MSTIIKLRCHMAFTHVLGKFRAMSVVLLDVAGLLLMFEYL